MALEPTKRGPPGSQEARSGAAGYPDIPTTPQAQQAPLSAKRQGEAGIQRLVCELRSLHPEIGDKELRDTLHRAVRVTVPLRRGRREDPRITRAVELYLARMPMERVLRDPQVLGPRPTGRPTDPDVWLYDKAAASVRRAVFRRAAKRKREHVRRPARRHNRPALASTETLK